MKRALVVVAAAMWACSVALAAAKAPGQKPKKPKAAPEEEEANRRIKEALQRRISFDFVETPARDALAFIQTILDVNVVVAPDVDRGKPLTLKVKNMATGVALQWMLKLVGARMEIRDGAIYISEAPNDPATAAKIKKLQAELERRRQHRLIGKAQVHLGKVATIELHLYDDQLPADVRNLLYKLLHEALTAELEMVRKRVPPKGGWKLPKKGGVKVPKKGPAKGGVKVPLKVEDF